MQSELDSASAALKGSSSNCCPGDDTGLVLVVSEKQMEWLHDGSTEWDEMGSEGIKPLEDMHSFLSLPDIISWLTSTATQ